MSRNTKVSLVLVSFVSMLLLFQNCSPGFSSLDGGSSLASESTLSQSTESQIVSSQTEINQLDENDTPQVEVNRLDENDTPQVEVNRLDENDTPGGLKKCDFGWVLVPGNADLGTKDFCIMKFEAQNSAQNQFAIRERVASEPIEPAWVVAPAFAQGLPESNFSTANSAKVSSTASSVKTPWVYITQEEAGKACARIGAHLTTMTEAQTVSRNLFLQPLNWDSNHVGQGCMYGGHLDLNPRNVLSAPQSEDPIAEHYLGTNDNEKTPPEKDMGKCFTRTRLENGVEKVHKNGWLSRRSFVLSTNQYIWDWSGNASEWIAPTCQNNASGTGAGFKFSGKSNGTGFFDYNPADHATSSEAGRASPVYTEWTQSYLQDYESLVFGPRNPQVPGSELMDSARGVGMYQGCAVNGNAIYRGGAAYHGYEGGIFQTHMDHTTKFNHNYISFRCVKAPYF